jgi:hypothetical protein
MLITPLAPMRLATQVPVLEGSAFDLALLMVGDGIKKQSFGIAMSMPWWGRSLL